MVRQALPDKADRRRGQRGAWLALIALLINLLLPPALLVGAAASDGLPTAFCGEASGRLPLGQPSPGQRSPAAPHHCFLCFTAVAGPAPLDAVHIAAPLPTGSASPGPIVEAILGPAPFTPALPRGPPLAA